MVTMTPDSSPYFFSAASCSAASMPAKMIFAIDVLLVVHLVHDPQQVGTFHVFFSAPPSSALRRSLSLPFMRFFSGPAMSAAIRGGMWIRTNPRESLHHPGPSDNKKSGLLAHFGNGARGSAHRSVNPPAPAHSVRPVISALNQKARIIEKIIVASWPRSKHSASPVRPIQPLSTLSVCERGTPITQLPAPAHSSLEPSAKHAHLRCPRCGWLCIALRLRESPLLY